MIYNEKPAWYTIQVYRGMEITIKNQIEIKAEEFGFTDNIKTILVPTQPIAYTTPKGEKKEKDKAIFEGYVFIEIENFDTNIWKIIQNLPKVSSFINYNNEPTKMKPHEIQKIIDRNNEVKTVQYKIQYEINDKVRVVYGPFENMVGYVKKFIPEKNEVQIDIEIFGRATPQNFELDAVQLES